MKKNTQNASAVVLGMALLFAASACQKERITELQEENPVWRMVTFRVADFETMIQPLLKMQHPTEHPKGSADFSVNKIGNVSASETQQVLYYWSFNQERTTPDVGIDTIRAEILFTGHGSPSWVNGKASAPYPAGRAYSLSGPQEVRFKIPISGVDALSFLRFDVGSSNTGPKDFEISYAIDDASEFLMINAHNPFENMNSTAWNHFAYDLSNLSLRENETFLWLKIVLKEGSREGVSGYNEKAGTFRIDNVSLTGTFMPVSQPYPEDTGGKVYYHLFNKSDSTLAESGQLPFSGGRAGVPEISIQLAEGEYFGSFIVNFSDGDLSFPDPIQRATDLYLYNPFDNAHAVQFGTVLSDIRVDAAMQYDLVLGRLYSEVQFQLEDTDLTSVGRIRITELYPMYYGPFSGEIENTNTFSTHTSWTLSPDWSDGRPEVRFHQFLGQLAQPRVVGYLVEVFGHGDDLLRTFTVEASVRNNSILIFKGKLLQGSESVQIGFPIYWNEIWENTHVLIF